MVNHVARVLATAVLVSGGDLAAAQTMSHPTVERQTTFGLDRTELRTGTAFEPRVDAAIQYVGNANLAANGSPQIDMAGLQIAPGFYGSHNTDSFSGAIDYSLIGAFWEDSDYDDVSHLLAANGQWRAVPEWFRIEGQASYSDAVIDPSEGLNYGDLGVFGASNLTEVATASVRPVLQHRFNDLELVARYSYGRVWYLDEGKGQPVVGFVSDQDSEDQSARVSFGTFDAMARISGQAFYDWQRSEFEDALPYEYERAGVNLGYRFARTLALVGDIGRESDLDASTTTGGLDSEFWSTGLRWEPSDRTSAEARYGERFFGETYFFSLNHLARQLEVTASYAEEPSIETRLLSLGDFEPGTLPPTLPGSATGRLNSTAFVGTDSRVSVTALGSRTTASITGYQYERDYIRGSLADDTVTGVTLGATRQLASNLATEASVSYSDFETTEANPGAGALGLSRYYDTMITLGVSRSSGPHLTLGGEAGYLNRSGGADYEGWWVALQARWTP